MTGPRMLTPCTFCTNVHCGPAGNSVRRCVCVYVGIFVCCSKTSKFCDQKDTGMLHALRVLKEFKGWFQNLKPGVQKWIRSVHVDRGTWIFFSKQIPLIHLPFNHKY